MIAARERSSGRRRVLPTVWPFYVLFVGLPVWWVLGLAGLVWPIVAFVMLFALLRRRRVDLPRGFLLWGGFVFWVLATATQIDSFGRAAGFAYRAAIYVAGVEKTLQAGIKRAKAAIESGAAKKKLDEFLAFTRSKAKAA